MMRKRHSFFAATLVALVLASAWAFGHAAGAQRRATGTGAAAPQAAAHPDVDPIDACESCHAGTHPEIVGAWESSKHSLGGVKCVVCHGSVGDGFTRAPTTTGCIGCHAPQVETMTAAFMKGKTCFTCHDPHALSPHRVAGGGR
jgi:hypothetical protein